MRLGTLAPAVLLALPLLGAAPPAAGAAEPESERLGALAALHPEDPDLRLALARALEHEGAIEEAERELERLVATPAAAARPSAWASLGRVRYRRGRPADALAALERAREAGSRDAHAEVYRGLALRALGRLEDSDRALESAARLAGVLEAETTLVRALNHYARGARADGDALLRRVIDLAPRSPSAREAQALLGTALPALTLARRLELDAYTGVELDSNVTLEGQGMLGATDESDSRLVWGAGLAGRLLERERASLTLGYRYGESSHENQKEFDLRSHRVFAAATWDAFERARLRLDAIATDAHLDDDRYLRAWTLRPNLFRELGPRAGITRAFAELERTRYHDPALLPVWERGGTTSALGVEQYVPLPRVDRGFFVLGGRIERVDTDASSLVVAGDRFAGDFDRRGAEGTARLRVPLGFELEAELSASFGTVRYRHRNLIDALVPDGSVDRRRDTTLGLGASVDRPLGKHVRVQLHWSYRDERSNVDPYTYDRHIVGLLVKAAL